MLTATDSNFSREVLENSGVVLIDFWAPWCIPCRMIAPAIDRINKNYGHKVKVGKLDIDENEQTSSQYDIMTIPTVIVFRDGKEVRRISGVFTEKALKDVLDQALAGQ